MVKLYRIEGVFDNLDETDKYLKDNGIPDEECVWYVVDEMKGENYDEES